VVVFAYAGLGAGPALGGEVRQAEKKVPLGIMWGWLVALVLFTAVATALFHAAPWWAVVGLIKAGKTSYATAPGLIGLVAPSFAMGGPHGGGGLTEPRCASERGLAMGGGRPTERRFTVGGSGKSVARCHRTVLAYWKFVSISLQQRVRLSPDFAFVPGKSPDFPPVWARGQAVRSAETRELHQHRAEER
jgi:hypothetical protein